MARKGGKGGSERMKDRSEEEGRMWGGGGKWLLKNPKEKNRKKGENGSSYNMNKDNVLDD